MGHTEDEPGVEGSVYRAPESSGIGEMALEGARPGPHMEKA